MHHPQKMEKLPGDSNGMNDELLGEMELSHAMEELYLIADEGNNNGEESVEDLEENYTSEHHNTTI